MTNDAVQTIPAAETAGNTSQQLEELAQRANEAHVKVGASAKYGLRCANDAGLALLEAKRICQPAKWLRWLAANFDGSRWTARRYMNFAMEVTKLGGFDGATLHHLTPHEAAAILRKLLARPGKRKKAKAAMAVEPTASRGTANGPGKTVARSHARSVQPAAALPADTPNADPFPRFKQLLEELMSGLEIVSRGHDCHDGPFAEMLLMDLRTPYADLLDYLADRDELKRLVPPVAT
jgi:hypothetical protein